MIAADRVGSVDNINTSNVTTCTAKLAVQDRLPEVIYFTTPDGDSGFATRFGRRYLGRDRWRGWELFGALNRRAGAALVAGGETIRVRIVA